VNAGFILFATDEQVRLMGQCSSLHMDGTFKTCPRPFAQVKFTFFADQIKRLGIIKDKTEIGIKAFQNFR
jgi:hypothetical protein